MEPAQPAIDYGKVRPDGTWPDGIWYDNPPGDFLNPELSPVDLNLPDDTELPYEDGIPLESNWHRHQMNLLIELIEYHWQDRNDFFAGGNMFIYFDRTNLRNRNYRGPDFFVVKKTTYNPTRKSWIAWNEGWRLPNVIVELASPSTINIDLKEKKRLYEQVFCTPEYFCYDPETLKLYGWRLKKGLYVPIPMDAQGQMFSREMGLKIGLWKGEHLRYHANWVRLYTPDGQLVPKFSEAEARKAQAEAERAAEADRRAEAEARKAQAEARKAQAEAERAAEADRRAEFEAHRAEAEALKAKAEAERATEADRRAEFEAQRAEAEAQRAGLAEAELERLKSLMAQKGILLPG